MLLQISHNAMLVKLAKSLRSIEIVAFFVLKASSIPSEEVTAEGVLK